MKIIKAWWWKEETNLGDALTPYIIEHLTHGKCVHIGSKWSDAIIYCLKKIYARLPIKWSLLGPIYFSEPNYILGVGSILAHKSDGRAIAWGCGFIKQDERFSGKVAAAVRGRYSAKILAEQGYPVPVYFGDPALLLPLIYKEKIKEKKQLAIIPHFTEYDKFKEKYGERFDVISLKTKDVEGAIDALCSYDYILSTSLHGIIIGHAYGVPVIWIEDKILEKDTFHFKFRDYFSSVGIEYYEPFRNIDNILDGNIPSFFKENLSKYTFTEKLYEIQRGLIKSAPFSVHPDFL